MKKFSLFLLILSPLVCASCALASAVTATFNVVGDVATDLGFEEVGAVANAGAAISKTAEDITPENEYYIGRAVAASLLTNYKIYNNEIRTLYLNAICSVIVANSDNPTLYNGYHVAVLDSDEVNAFSTSGGHIFVTRGMLNCAKSEDELACVIAHEIAHIQLKHGMKAIKSSRITSAITATASTTLAVAGETDLSSTMDDIVGDVFEKMVHNGYSKKQEFQADSLAVKLLIDSGYSPLDFTLVLEELEKNQDNNKKGIYKTHPSPKKRINNIYDTLKEMKYVAEESSEARFIRYFNIMTYKEN